MDLIGEICQLGLFLWWDRVDQEVKLRANRPLDYNETPQSIDDDADIIEQTISMQELNDKRLTDVIFYHGQLDPTETREGNYRQAFVATDTDAKSDNEYGQDRIIQIFSPWLGRSGDGSVASAVSTRLLYRYRDTPRRLKFKVDIRKKDTIRVADPITVNSRLLVDETGAETPGQFQVMSSTETDSGNRIELEVETYQFTGRFGFITENGRSDYGSSTAAEIERGTYILGTGATTFADGTGPYVIF